MREVLKSVFDNEYQGYPVFIDNVLRPIFGADIEVFPVKEELGLDKETLRKASIKELYRVATIDRMGTDTIEVFDVTLDDKTIISRSRVGIQRIIRSAIFQYTHAFMLFHYENPRGRNWRFSYAYKQDKNSSTTEAKRYTYLFGPDLHCRTAIDRFSILAQSSKDNQALLDAFSVEALSDEFFDTYRKQYAKFVKYITGKEFIKKGNKWVENTGNANEIIYNAFSRDDKRVRDYVKKMMGRITFLHFLQRKRWLNGDLNFMLHLFQNSDKQDNYLEAVLEPLFFGILNTKEEDRAELFADKGWDKGLLDDWKSIPYLNGGLFEADEEDKVTVTFPRDYFAELFAFYSEYNFTVDENDPDDAEVGVDPEMLGKIFENLLEDNKDKGTFYTPKEIVRYMCQESLVAYLVGKSGIDEHRIRDFVMFPYDNVDKFKENELENLLGYLDNVKICDPAIGSGAFPMGLLNELVHCEEAIVLGQEKKPARAELKKSIIKNNIYGVDIEKGAIDIARLRFWLSLVVDEDRPSPLPNLDYKIMQGNSLLESYQGVDLSHLIESSDNDDLFAGAAVPIQRQLEQKINEYYSCVDHRRKLELKDEIKNLITQQLEAKGIKIDLSGIDVTGNTHFFLWHTWFSDVFKRPSNCNRNSGFDIVIGNPPYVKEYTNRSAFDGFRESSPYYQGKMDLWYGFACNSIDILCENGILCFIATNNWTTNTGAKKLRAKILSDASIKLLIDFGSYMIFGDSASIQTMIMIFKKTKDNLSYSFDYRHLDKKKAAKIDAISILSKNLHDATYLLPELEKIQYLNKCFTFSNDESLSILSKMERGAEHLLPSDATNGIHSHFDCVTNKMVRKNPTLSLGEGIFGLMNDEIASMNLDSNEKSLLKPYYPDSTYVHLYYTEKQNTSWIIYTDSRYKNSNSMDKYPHLKTHLDKFKNEITSDNKPYGLHRAREERFFKGEKIAVLRKCVGRPCFSYSNFDTYLSATFYVIKTDKYNLKFLTGLLNSKLIMFWLKKKGKMQGDNYQLDKEPLLSIPIKTDYTTENIIAQLVDKIILLKASNSETFAIEHQIDLLVYKLYGLSDEEISTVESI